VLVEWETKHETEVTMPNVQGVSSSRFAGASAWIGSALCADAGVLSLPRECLEEIVDLARLLDDNPLPTLALDPGDFDLPACRDLMARAHDALENGLGFVILHRLPLQTLQKETSIKIYWLLARMLARPVAQKWTGEMIYTVADLTGKRPGNGIRPDITNAEQNFHNDNSYNVCPPDYVALLCLQTAKSGGVSRVVSFETAHNLMQERHPELLERLFRPYRFDRQREHAAGGEMTINQPVFTLEGGRLKSRLSRYLIEQGYDLAGEHLDETGRAALDALTAIIDEPVLYKEFYFEPGQIQILDNRRLGHKRTGFEDWPEPERRRALIRLWLRNHGRPFYGG
jgi:alpha-ketoglutarate-dependent taurine dioxygenase